MVEVVDNDLGRKPEQASADSGYCGEPDLETLVALDGYVAPGHAKQPGRGINLVDR